MYEQQAPSDWGYIVGDSGASIVLVSKRSLVDKVRGVGVGAQGWV